MNIYRGSTGPAVLGWQNFLNTHGFPCGRADGIFGLKTEAATKAFQASNGIEEDGIVGPSTQARAEQAGAVLPPPAAITPLPVDADLTLRANEWPREADASVFFGYPPALTHVACPWPLKTWDNGWHPVPFIVCNPKVAASITRILNAKWILAGRDPDAIAVAGFNIFDGCYNDRSVRGNTGKLSMHARAAACDWNAEKWPLWSERRMPDNYADIWRAESWRLGEDYTGRKDPMHVEACK